jgi:hypothetical protein
LLIDFFFDLVFKVNLKSLLYCLESFSDPKTKEFLGTLRNQEKSNVFIFEFGKSLVKLEVIVFVNEVLSTPSELLSLFIDSVFLLLGALVFKLYEKNFSELFKSIKVLNMGSEDANGA